MILDDHLYMSDAQNLATKDAATASTDYIDTTVAGNAGQPLWLVCRVETAFACAGSNPTLDVALQSDSASTFETAVTHWSAATIAEATLVDEYTICKMPLPDGLGRYIRMLYTPSAAFNSGKIDAFLTMNPDRT